MGGIDLSGKNVLVTGGSRGIGAEICRTLASYGARVFVHYHTAGDGAREVLREMNSPHGDGDMLQADIARPSDVETMFEKLDQICPQLDILVNNAGAESIHSAVDLPLDEWDRIMNINLRGSFHCAQLAARRMIGHGGVIVNLSSIHDQIPRKGLIHYCAAKAGVAMITKVLAVELAEHNIRVVSVSPGAIETEMNREEIAKVGRDVLNSSIPLGRLGRPEEVANLVAFICSDLAGYATGSTEYLDGGYMLTAVKYDPR